MLSKLLTYGFIALLSFSAVACHRPKFEAPKSAIVRLHDTKTGRFFCSGTVISDERVLTASHCVVREVVIFGILLSAEIIKEVDVKDAAGNLIARMRLESANPNTDVALLAAPLGALKDLPKIGIETNPDKIRASLRHLVSTCGYPYGGKIRCPEATHLQFSLFSIIGKGYLFPGMSGGPVIDLETGNIIAVNTAVSSDTIILSPIVELFDMLDVPHDKPKEPSSEAPRETPPRK